MARPSLRFQYSTDRSNCPVKSYEFNKRQVNDITDGDHGSLCYIVNFKEHDFGETVLLL